MHSRKLTYLTAFTMVLALAGCSNTDDETPDLEETTDASVSDPVEYIPASEDGPAENVPEPRLPEAVTKNTEEGATATLNYFWEAVDYARLTGDTEPLSLVSHEKCEFCGDHIEGWQTRYANGDWAVLHGEIDIEVGLVKTHVDPDEHDEWAEISFVLTEPPADLYVEGKREVPESVDEESRAEWLADLSFDGSAQRWYVEWMGVIDPDEESTK